MITGFFKTPSERIENVVLNTTLLTQVGTILLKVAGLSSLTWLTTFAPLGALVGIIILMIAYARAYKYYLQLRDTWDLIQYQRHQKKAMEAQRAKNEQNAANNG